VYGLCNDLKALIDHISTQAEQGRKSLAGETPLKSGNFRLYHNEVVLGDNSFCVTSDYLMMTFLTLNVTDLMVISEKKFCKKVTEYLTNMMNKSSLISSVSENERNRFFNLLHKKVDATREKIRNT
jgi:hypothetical protein